MENSVTSIIKADDVSDSISQWLISEGLSNFELSDIFVQLCEKLMTHIGLKRAMLSMREINPMIESKTILWNDETGLQEADNLHGSNLQDTWLKSPVYAMFKANKVQMRIDIQNSEDVENYPLLVDLRGAGYRDYYLALTSFDGDNENMSRESDGMATSWATDKQDGFSDDDILIINKIQHSLGILAKLTNRQAISKNIIHAYLGKDVGRRVLSGQIQRGDLKNIQAVIWYSDLRDSTPLANNLNDQAFLEVLNTYFECTAGSVLENGGEVLRFIGDAVLAIFPYENTEQAEIAAQNAINASLNATEQMAVINQQRQEKNEAELRFGLALHCGVLAYGNIGVPSRVEFSVIGTVANEVARIEGLTKLLNETVIVTKQFSRLLPIQWKDLGFHQLKGVNEALQLFTPIKDLKR